MSLLSRKVARLVLALALMAAPIAATARAAELSSQAREPYQRGMAAAQGRDWPLALRYFSEAQKADPEVSEIWFNLGLAASKMPGYEMRTIALFKAYLLANPDAPKAEAIRGEITRLESSFESKAEAILKRLEALLMLRQSEPSGGYTPDVQQARRDVMMQTGWSLAEGRFYLGDPRGALRGLRATNGDDWLERWQEYGKRNGTYEVALTTSMSAAGKLDDASDMGRKRYDHDLVGFFLEEGDVAGAQRFLDPAQTDGWSTVACLAHFRRDENLQYESLQKAKTTIADLLGSGTCERDMWWSVGRIQFLLQRGISGTMVDYQHDDTNLASSFQDRELDSSNSGYALVGLSSAAANFSGMLREYRKIRGPASARDDYAEAYFQSGNSYFNKGQYDRAILSYLQAIRVNSDYAAAYHNIGDSYYQKAQYDEAIQNYRRATGINPDDAESFFFIGHCYNKMGRYDLAVESYQRAMRLDPDYGLPADMHGTQAK